MDNPLVSVLMPVYNGEKFLEEAILSILNQTFKNFEFLIINDGSNDNSEGIIKQFNDSRIVYIKNETNLGIIQTLNKGINQAKGKYIARMDSDDISKLDRLEKQVSYLESNPLCSVIASKIQLINEKGIREGYWDDDLQTTTFEEIKSYLPKLNCIAHPSIIIRTDIAKQYLYDLKQTKSEDWDLWLRLISDNKRIEKLNEILLLYRIHIGSITNQSHQHNVYRKILRLQKNYFLKRIREKKVNTYDLNVLRNIPSTFDKAYLKGRVQKNFKRVIAFFNTKLWSILGSYFRFIYYSIYLLINKNKNGLFFFFPFYHVGGAEKVHFNILETVKDKKPWLFITAKSVNKAFFHNFKDNCDKLFFVGDFGKIRTYFIQKLIAKNVNKVEQAVTFGCNSSFYYKLLNDFINQVKCIDLIHAFSGEDYKAAEDWSLPYVYRLDKRIFISQKVIEDLKNQYSKENIDLSLLDRVIYIPNYTNIPFEYPLPKRADCIELLYVGRDSAEKRIHLVQEIGVECSKRSIPIKLTMIGNIKSKFSYGSFPIQYIGELNDVQKLNEYYKKSHIVLITSTREGFPMVIMEGMAHGLVPMSTDVGDCALHLLNSSSGFVIKNHLNEAQIVKEFADHIETIYNDNQMFNRLSQNAYSYAKETFNISNFRNSYRNILLK